VTPNAVICCTLLIPLTAGGILQGGVKMHLWCGGICNNHIIANCLQSVPVKEF